MLVLAVAATVAPHAVAQAAPGLSVSGYVGAVSDYRWRGVSQTGNDPAAQGELVIEHESGWHGDMWASAPTKSSGDLEIDFTIGRTFHWADGSLDIAVADYVYPDLDDADYATLVAVYERRLGPWSARGRLEYAPPQVNLGQHSTYASIEAERPLGDTGFSVVAGIGWEAGEFTLDGQKWDYTLAGKYDLGPAALALTYAGTDETVPTGASDVYGGSLSLGVEFGF